jgi:ubiquinone/menaquinone biosynthesis C-methylase UbiE
MVEEASGFAAAINAQYGPANLGDNILSALEGGGKNLDELTQEDLAACSEFHIGGRAATLALARLAGIEPGMEVIDLGSGLGGPARTLATEFGAAVTALELSKPYHDAARMLADKVGVTGVNFVNGSALDIPAEDDSFDVVWMQHAQMNIEDKVGMFREIRRVLKPGGIFAWHGILRGSNAEPVLFPLTWDDTGDLTFMVTVEEYVQLAADIGLVLDQATWRDMNEHSLEFFEVTKERMEALPPEQRLGLNLLMGPSIQEKLPNLVRNIAEDRVSVHMAVFRAG